MARPKISMDRVVAAMERDGLDALVAAGPENVFYLSDLPVSPVSSNRLLFVVRSSSPSFCVVTRNGDAKLVMTSAAVDLARANSWVSEFRTYKTGTYIVRPKALVSKDVAADPLQALVKTVQEDRKIGKVGIDSKMASASIVDGFRSLLRGSKVVDSSILFELLRMIKSKEEIARFVKANDIVCRAINKVIGEARVGTREDELHNILKSSILNDGGTLWQQTTIASGPENGPDIYAQPTSRKLTKGDIIRLDIGGVYKGYTADLSRTLAVGEASAEARKIYRVLRDAEQILVDECKPGVKASHLHGLVVKYVKKHLDSGYERGNVGHGVGVDLYDRPFISANDDTEMQAGMTLSLEVPYHKVALGGFNVEDSVLVRENDVKLVSDLPRELIIV